MFCAVTAWLKEHNIRRHFETNHDRYKHTSIQDIAYKIQASGHETKAPEGRRVKKKSGVTAVYKSQISKRGCCSGQFYCDSRGCKISPVFWINTGLC